MRRWSTWLASLARSVEELLAARDAAVARRDFGLVREIDGYLDRLGYRRVEPETTAEAPARRGRPPVSREERATGES